MCGLILSMKRSQRRGWRNSLFEEDRNAQGGENCI